MSKGKRRPRGRNRKGYCLYHKKWLTSVIKCGKTYSCSDCNHFSLDKTINQVVRKIEGRYSRGGIIHV